MRFRRVVGGLDKTEGRMQRKFVLEKGADVIVSLKKSCPSREPLSWEF